MLEFKEVTSSGLLDGEDLAKKCQVWNRVWSKSSFSEGNCCEILNEQKNFTSLGLEKMWFCSFHANSISSVALCLPALALACFLVNPVTSVP